MEQIPTPLLQYQCPRPLLFGRKPYFLPTAYTGMSLHTHSLPTPPWTALLCPSFHTESDNKPRNKTKQHQGCIVHSGVFPLATLFPHPPFLDSITLVYPEVLLHSEPILWV